MLFRVGIALFLSFALMGGATWVRLSNKEAKRPSLLAVDTPETLTENEYRDIYWPKEGEGSEESLTTTDLISRQLVSEYITLSGSNALTASSINDLAQKYIDLAPTLKKTGVQKIPLSSLKTVPDSKQAYQEYDEYMNAIYEDYLAGFGPESPDEMDGEDPDILQGIYQEMLDDIMLVEVPKSVAPSHLKLVNHYVLLNELLADILSETLDPIIAMANLIDLNEKIQEERAIIEEINEAISFYGNL